MNANLALANTHITSVSADRIYIYNTAPCITNCIYCATDKFAKIILLNCCHLYWEVKCFFSRMHNKPGKEPTHETMKQTENVDQR